MKITINVTRIVGYFRQNLGSPFVIVFQLLLIACVLLLNRGYSDLADTVAIYAYYSLVIGVVLQLASFLRHKEGLEKEKSLIFPLPKGARCAITFSFDECFKETINLAVPLLDRCHFKGTFYIATGFVDKGSFEGLDIASWNQLKNITKKGHEIGSHTVTHRSLSDDLRTKIKQFFVSFPRSPNKRNFLKRAYHFLPLSRKSTRVMEANLSLFEETILSKQIIENKFSEECVSFAFPGGGYNRSSTLLVKNAGYESARTADIGFNDLTSLDPYSLKIMCWDRWTRSEEANRWVDRAIEGGYWLIELFHLVSNEEEKINLYHLHMNEFEKHIEYVHRKGKNVWVAPQKEVIREICGKSR